MDDLENSTRQRSWGITRSLAISVCSKTQRIKPMAATLFAETR